MKYLFFIISYCYFLPLFGQEQQDSLEVELRQKLTESLNDSLKVHYLFELTKVVEKYNIDQGRELMNQTMQIIDDIDTPSFYFLEKKADLLDVLGKYESRQTNYKQSLAYRLQALKVREQINDSIGIAKSYHSLAMVFRYQKEYTKSKSYFLKSISIQKRHKLDSTQLARTYNMLGVIYYYTKENDSAMYYYRLSRDYYTTPKNKAKPNDNIAIIYYNNGNYEKAIEIYNKNLAIFKSTKNYNFTSSTLMHLAKIHSDLERHQEAIAYIDEALTYTRKQGYTSNLPTIYQLRSHIYEQMGNHKYALGYFKTYKYYYDSIFNVNNAKKITEIELKHTFQKERLADSLQFANEKREIQLKTQAQQARNQLYIASLIIAAGGIIALLFVMKHRKKLNNESLKKQQLEKELVDEKLRHTNYQAKQLIADNKMRLQFKQGFLTKLKKIKQHTNAVDISDFQSLISDLTAQIRTESKFDSIGNNLEQLDQEFNKKLRILYPNLSKSEREICALIRMNLSLKEIMIIRNVTMGSIKASRHRIRKKMELERGQELEQVILDLI